jgi:hypothetical protein
VAKSDTPSEQPNTVVVERGQSIASAMQTGGFDDMVQGNGDSTALAVVAEDNVPSLGAVNYSMEMPEFERNEVAMPRLRLAQAMTPEVNEMGTAKAGQWLILGSDPFDEVTIIPVMFGRERVLIEDPNAERPVVLCSSPDGVTGIGKPGGSCARCPLAQWVESPTGKSQKPRCTMINHYLSFVVETAEIVDLQLKGSGMVAARYVNTMIQTKGFGKFALKLSSKQEKGPRGAYYAPQVKLTTVTQEDFELAREIASTGV